VIARWAGVPCADPLGPSGHFGHWAKLAAPGRGPDWAHHCSGVCFFLFYSIFFSELNLRKFIQGSNNPKK
jgi:hypothetical protein